MTSPAHEDISKSVRGAKPGDGPRRCRRRQERRAIEDQLREEIRRAERDVQQWQHQLEMGIVPILPPNSGHVFDVF